MKAGTVEQGTAAYTKSYTWSKFDHNLIAGPHIDGEFHEGYTEDANSGAFYYIHSSKKWDFVYNGYGQHEILPL